ncbi:MAG: TAXI family TRAP transporter solute-binding subunit [Candidatus Atribacteria bacterium]|jgi:TRAP transporter TAXI family solute receptor|nr:TAXI family TRAP transporter solute-binding subunit [Candidatus Atribacteria bacterium]
MKKFFSILLIVVAVIAVLGTNSLAQQKFLAIATGGTGGTYYPLGGALAQLISEKVPGLVATAQTSGASVANCNLIGNHEIETAFSQANTTYWCYAATGLQEGKEPITNLRGIASIYPETIHIVATKASGVKTIADLKGKRVGVGAPNSGTEADARIILNAHGLTYDEMSIDYIDFNEVADRLIDGQIDAGFTTAGYPTSSIINIATTRDLVLVPVDPVVAQKLVDDIPYYGITEIPAGMYRGVDEPVLSLATPALWVCDSKLDPTLVYKMTKALWENNDILAEVHAQGKNIKLETALNGMAVPLHPGAELYYKEIGAIE